MARQFGVRSPSKHTSLKRLEAIAADNFHNPDTGLELSEGETRERINELRQAKADRKLSGILKTLNQSGKRRKSKKGNTLIPKSQIARWVTIKIKGKKYPVPIRDGPDRHIGF